jgi:hypothetical protein
MGLSLGDFNFSLDTLFGMTTQFKLLKVTEWREFDEGKQTGDKKLLGHKYQVADLEKVVKFNVKVEGATPVITNEDVLKATAPIFVTFTKTRASFYGKSLYDCDISVTAESVVIKGKSQQATQQ